MYISSGVSMELKRFIRIYLLLLCGLTFIVHGDKACSVEYLKSKIQQQQSLLDQLSFDYTVEIYEANNTDIAVSKVEGSFVKQSGMTGKRLIVYKSSKYDADNICVIGLIYFDCIIE
jgi:hypothetical protein